MTKQEKIKFAQKFISASWSCGEDIFSKRENLFIETEQVFFEIITFGCNAVIRADRNIIDWCVKEFTDTSFDLITDGENLHMIESKMREYGKKLGGEHLHFLRLITEGNLPKPQGFTFELYEREQVLELYQDSRFDNALNYTAKNEILAIVAKAGNDIAAVVASEDYRKGLCQLGVDTIHAYRGEGLAAYLVKEMALECEKRMAIPYYTTWSANIASMRTALAAGFQPVWLEYYAEDMEN